MINFITNLDYMGREFKFNMGKNGESLKTFLGGISTIIQSIGFMVLLWYYGQDIYLRKSPSMIKSEGMKDDYIKWDIDSSKFNFAMNVQDDFGNYLNDPRDFIYTMFYLNITMKIDGSFDLITSETEMDICSSKHLNNKTLNFYKLYESRCVENNFTLGGQWNTENLLLPTFLLKRCNSDIEKKLSIKCRTNEELIEKYKSFYFNIYLQKNLIDPSKYEIPVE